MKVKLIDILCTQSVCYPNETGIKRMRHNWPENVHKAIMRNVGRWDHTDKDLCFCCFKNEIPLGDDFCGVCKEENGWK